MNSRCETASKPSTGGRIAQFSHSDFGGMSQWSPGMSMVGDMFNTKLKSKLDALCTDIVAALCRRRSQLSINFGVDRLVAGRIG